jgi:hypothetical protein
MGLTFVSVLGWEGITNFLLISINSGKLGNNK